MPLVDGTRLPFLYKQLCMSWIARWVFAAIIKYVLHIIRRFSACTLAYTRTYMYMSTGRFLHSLDTIAYAKVSGADSIVWWTQLHLTPVKTRWAGRSLSQMSPCYRLNSFIVGLNSCLKLWYFCVKCIVSFSLLCWAVMALSLLTLVLSYHDNRVRKSLCSH